MAIEKKQEEEQQQDDLSTAIRKISASMAKLTKSGLNKKAVIALLFDDTKISKRTIGDVLDSLQDLERKYTQQEKSDNTRGGKK